ncbi:MAG: hypothetical protein HPM95_11855 [Alphaproteobacteria bacterium]|nr:hypothetical protein [Alphaproteobacteria bacterium]
MAASVHSGQLLSEILTVLRIRRAASFRGGGDPTDSSSGVTAGRFLTSALLRLERFLAATDLEFERQRRWGQARAGKRLQQVEVNFGGRDNATAIGIMVGKDRVVIPAPCALAKSAPLALSPLSMSSCMNNSNKGGR